METAQVTLLYYYSLFDRRCRPVSSVLCSATSTSAYHPVYYEEDGIKLVPMAQIFHSQRNLALVVNPGMTSLYLVSSMLHHTLHRLSCKCSGSSFQQFSEWLALTRTSIVSGCWLSDPLNNYFGRRGTIFFSSIFCLFPVIGSGLSQSWEQLFVTRILLGIGMGSKASTVPIFAAENSPALIRGSLVMSKSLSS